MMTKRILALTIGLGLLAGEGSPQDIQKVAFGVFSKNVADASYVYCKLAGKNGDPFGDPVPGRGTIQTTGSSVTIDETVVGSNPFTEVVVGDMLVVTTGGVTYRRAVVTRASAAQITVDTAITLAANTQWAFYRSSCGTAVTDGWIPVSLKSELSFGVDWKTKAGTSIDHSFECRLAGSAPAALEQASTTTATSSFLEITAGVWDECRIGLKISTDTGDQLVDSMIGVKGFTK
jgi:hypothetical protein